MQQLESTARRSVDPATATSGIFGSFFHQGLSYMPVNRHVAHRDVYEEYVA